MNNHDLQIFLKQFPDDIDVSVWIKIDNEELSDPNMATITADEIFDYQDQLDVLILDDDNILNMFDFVESLLNTLQSRLHTFPEFVEEMERIRLLDKAKKNVCDIDSISNFYDLINEYYTARTLQDLYDTQKRILMYIKKQIDGVRVWICNDILFIEKQNNASCSTSIIAKTLGINAKRINDKQWEKGIWVIDLKGI